MATKGVQIVGRRWFQRTAGNTYHSVEVWANGERVFRCPFAYGYDDQYLQTAYEWMQANGYANPGERYGGTLQLREKLGATWTVSDVARKGDL